MYTVMKVPAVIGACSLVGFSGKFPLSRGNYFGLANPQVRVLNFWAENLEEAVKRFLKDGLVQIRLYKFEVAGQERQVCLIDDPRIPADWYYNKLCFTGCARITAEVAKDIYDYVGDPDNEYEQFTDPEMYYARQGGILMQKGGGVHYKLGGKPEDLVAALLEKRKKEQTPPVPEGVWLDPKVHPMQPGLVVKLFKNGSVWAGYYTGAEKMATCELYYSLPDPKASRT